MGTNHIRNPDRGLPALPHSPFLGRRKDLHPSRLVSMTPARRKENKVKQTLLQEKYPIYSLELDRGETSYATVDEIVDHFRQRIEAHRCACFIAVFDHFAHTLSLPEGRIGEGIRAAKNIVFCFGIALPDPHALAVRPRSIGVAETDDGFLITFMEAPMPLVNAAMEDWAKGLRNRQSLSA
jgi:hypothetical protein